MEHNDKKIINDVLLGKTHSFKIIVEKYENMLFDLSLRLTGNMQESEDIVQKSFIKAYRNLDKYKQDYKFSNWIYTIALNLIKNHLRHRKVIRFLSLDFKPKEENLFEIEDKSAVPERKMEQEDFSKTLQTAIGDLPSKLKEVFTLHYLHEKDLASVGNICGLSQNAVRLRLMRARNIIYGKIKTDFPQSLK
ncbi:MAG TPA: RNA polymerase sigma factor [Elusimicrobiales bacterium]|nr:RNA polymerase sigma factor [Elusimicrobiales bacterium]